MSKLIDAGRLEFFCVECGTKLKSPKVTDIGAVPREYEATLNKAEQVTNQRTASEEALTWVKSVRRDRGDVNKRPQCFISYAWGNPKHESWVYQLAQNLQNADIDIILDRWHNPPGTRLSQFVELIESADYICTVGTRRYGN